MQNKVASGGLQVRPHNRRLLLQILRHGGSLSRADVATAAGLSEAAVTNVAADLLSAGLIEEHSPLRDVGRVKIGRPASRLSLASHGPTVLAVQFGAGFLIVGLCDLKGAVLASQQATFDVREEPNTVISNAIQMCRRLLRRKSLMSTTVIGVGIGAAGTVDRDQRLVHHAALGWNRVRIADAFEKALRVDAVVDHNVRAMAIGESRYGVGRGLSSLAFVYVRTGVGAGLILDGKAYRNHTNGAAELGHLRIGGGARPCLCGARGCLETVVSDGVVQRRMSDESLLPSGSRDSANFARILVERVRAGDASAVAIRDELVGNLSAALLNVVNLLNPEAIVLGGLLYDLSSVLLAELQDAVAAQVLPALSGSICVVPTAHGHDAGLVGAAAVALDRFVFGEKQLQLVGVS